MHLAKALVFLLSKELGYALEMDSGCGVLCNLASKHAGVGLTNSKIVT